MWSWNWSAVRIGLAACLALLLSACSLIRDQPDPTTVSIRGVPPTLEQLNVSATAYSQDQLVNELIQTAGLSSQPPSSTPDWSLVTKAGIYEIGRQCDQYLDALFRFNREQRAGRQDLAAAAAATGAIMGISGASAKALAITAAAFGLASSLFDASVNSVLFTIEPSALRNVALQGLKNYFETLDLSKITSRPDMLIALQGYLAQCSPAALEANINNAASGSPFAVTNPDKDKARAAAALAAPAATTVLQPKTGGPSDSQRGGASAGSGASAPAIAAEVVKILRAQNITNPSAPLSKPVTVPGLQGCVGKAECTLPAERLRQYQTALCVDPTAPGEAGAFGPLTRNAFHDFLVGKTRPTDPAKTPDKMDDSTKSYFDELKKLDCKDSTQEFKNAYEVGWFGSVPKTSTGRIQDLQSNLQKLLNKDPPLAKSGMLDKDTRDAIEKFCGKRELDFECRTKINDSVNKLGPNPAKPSGAG